MQIIEKFVQGKRGKVSLCEDGYVVTPHFAAVVDGSTSKVKGRSGGLEAMRLVCEAVRSLSPEADKEEMLRHFTAVLSRHNPPEAQRDAAYRLTCSAVIFSARRRVVWMVGDCQCRFAQTTYTHPKLVDSILTEARCDAVTYLLAHGHTTADIQRADLGRAIILDALRSQTNFQNDPNPLNPYRYPVFDGTPIDPTLVPEWAIPQSVQELILASDGYPVLKDTLADTERELHHLLLSDPLCIRENKATKCLVEGNLSFDDRCYLRLNLGENNDFP